MAKDRTRDAIQATAKAHTDLNLFAVAEEICSSGSFMSAESYADAQRIAAMCRRAQQRCLARYDKAMTKATVAVVVSRTPTP